MYMWSCIWVFLCYPVGINNDLTLNPDIHTKHQTVILIQAAWMQKHTHAYAHTLSLIQTLKAQENMDVHTQIYSEGPDKTWKAFAFVPLLVSFLWHPLAFSFPVSLYLYSSYSTVGQFWGSWEMKYIRHKAECDRKLQNLISHRALCECLRWNAPRAY